MKIHDQADLKARRWVKFMTKGLSDARIIPAGGRVRSASVVEGVGHVPTRPLHAAVPG